MRRALFGLAPAFLALAVGTDPDGDGKPLTADEILDRAAAAQGGRAIGGPVKELLLEAESIVYKEKSRVQLDVRQMMKLDGSRKKFRSETEILKEGASIRATDGSRPWQQKGKNVTPLTRVDFPQDLEELERDIDFLETCARAFAIENLKGDGIRFERLPDESRDGMTAMRLRRVPAPPSNGGGAAATGDAASALERPLVLFIEAGTYRLLGVELEESPPDAPRRNICFTGRAKNVKIGKAADETLVVPHKIALFTRDRLDSETWIDSVEINPGLDDAAFTMPKK